MVVYAPKIRYHYPLRYVIPAINTEEMTYCLPNKWKYGLPIENNHVSFANEIKQENYIQESLLNSDNQESMKNLTPQKKENSAALGNMQKRRTLKYDPKNSLLSQNINSDSRNNIKTPQKQQKYGKIKRYEISTEKPKTRSADKSNKFFKEMEEEK